MSILRKTIVATALLGAGLGATTGAAFAGENHDGGHSQGSWSQDHSQGSKDSSGKHDDGGENGSGVAKRCGSGVDAGQRGTDQSGPVNAQGVQTITPANACSNNVPVNVLGVQVPVQDASANAPVASPTDGADAVDTDDAGDAGTAGDAITDGVM